ncbi:uncharacterized protein TM35_000601030 [Trypanosoma theileri]|uniref:Mucin TcMUCII n=1 Tax=Trypanosoma theileri TaxID=67003 RepID=A0A1X0NG19_9TRYP|nr:uncharacterized protein TM35_000601030 [Trypanosoma theileri]ORC83672.1 hypothetical protein TM35_000601030 [Trypanosoma theileri]
MAKAVMVRCYLLCLLTFTLCCTCELVWAQPIKHTLDVNDKLVVCFPPSERILLPNGTPKCNITKPRKTQEHQVSSTTVEKQENQQLKENKPVDAGTDTGRESHPDTHQPTNGENTNLTGSSDNEGKETSGNASQSSPENSSNTSPSQNAGESGAAETGPTSNPNDAENANTTTTTTNTTTTTLPPVTNAEINNSITSTVQNKANVDSSVSSVWMRTAAPLLIMVVLFTVTVY